MGTYLARPSTRKDRDDIAAPSGLRCAVASMQGWRIAQEDAHLALPRFDENRGLSLFGVFDGHCGGVVSHLVTKWLPEKIAASPSYRAGDYARALREGFLAVDVKLDSPLGRKAVKEEAQKIRRGFVDNLKIDSECEAEGISVVEMLDELCADNPDGMGCTAVVALLEHQDCNLSLPAVHIHVANCGDSRCVIWDDRGRATAMSRDHKPRNQEELWRIQCAGGWVTGDGRIEDNLNLSRALGDFAYKRTRKSQPPEQQMISGVPEVRSRALRPSDRYVLIGCDGVWETRRGSQATVDAVRKFMPAEGSKGKLSKALAHFLDENLAKDETTGLGMDNMTALLVELPEVPAGGRILAISDDEALASDAAAVLKRPAAAPGKGKGRGRGKGRGKGQAKEAASTPKPKAKGKAKAKAKAKAKGKGKGKDGDMVKHEPGVQKTIAKRPAGRPPSSGQEPE